jgi:hypothetical protein
VGRFKSGAWWARVCGVWVVVVVMVKSELTERKGMNEGMKKKKDI